MTTWATALNAEGADRDRMTEDAKRESPRAQEYPVWYVANHWHRQEQGLRLRFDNRPYLEGMFKVWPQNPRNMDVVVKKAPQEGVSELAIVVALTYSGWFGSRVWYILPKADLRDDFVSTRLDTSIAYVPEYQARLRESVVARDNTKMKLLGGGGFIKCATSTVRNEFLTHPCDIAIPDELNECNLANVALIDDRFSGHESRRCLFKISTPTTKGFGISAEYDRSDRRKWHIPCPNCSEMQVLDWWKNIMEPGDRPDTWRLIDRDWKPGCGRDIHVLCSACGHPMDRLVMGEWKAERPDRRVIGFHVSKLFSAARSVESMHERYIDMVEDQKPGAGEVFFNSVLGDDFTGGKVQITEELLSYCSTLDPYDMPPRSVESEGRCVAGVDVGKQLHVVIDRVEGGRRRAVFIGRLGPGMDGLADLFERYNVEVAVVDVQDITWSMNARARFNTPMKRNLYACRYVSGRLTRPGRDEGEALVTIDRTMALDESKADMDTGRRLLPRGVLSLDRGEFKTSLTGPVRKDDKYKQGGVDKTRTIWTKVSGDHYRHADTYAWIASTLLRPETPMDWGGGTGDQSGRNFKGPEAGGRTDWGLGSLDSGDGGRVF